MIMETRLQNSAGTINKQALVTVYDQHSQELYRYAYRLAGDPDVAEDCVAETFSRYLRLVREGRGPTENVRAYLYRMAHNWITDHFRRYPMPLTEKVADQRADPEANPLHQVTRAQERERVRAALLSLPPDQRRVIELRFLEEWSHEAVAEALGKSVEATRALQHRALTGLRRILLDEDRLDKSDAAASESLL